jgi:hypothetical protein
VIHFRAVVCTSGHALGPTFLCNANGAYRRPRAGSNAQKRQPYTGIGYDTSDSMKNQSHDCRARDTMTVC